MSVDGGDLDLGMRPHEALNTVEHIFDVTSVCCDCREREAGALPKILVVHLCGCDPVAKPCGVQQMADD